MSFSSLKFHYVTLFNKDTASSVVLCLLVVIANFDNTLIAAVIKGQPILTQQPHCICTLKEFWTTLKVGNLHHYI